MKLYYNQKVKVTDDCFYKGSEGIVKDMLPQQHSKPTIWANDPVLDRAYILELMDGTVIFIFPYQVEVLT